MKVALVTGGRVRLGAAISAFLKKSGWRVLTSSHRADAGADIVADLADPLGAARLYSAALDILGGRPPDALVNNAALLVGGEREIETVNYESAKKLTILMAGREEGRGAVVNILDASDQSAQFPSYAKSKAMLRDYTLKSAALFSGTLAVNAVAPGPVMAPEGVRMKGGLCPLGRPTPDDVAGAVSYLLGARTVTGAILPVDGGLGLLSS